MLCNASDYRFPVSFQSQPWKIKKAGGGHAVLGLRPLPKANYQNLSPRECLIGKKKECARSWFCGFIDYKAAQCDVALFRIETNASGRNPNYRDNALCDPTIESTDTDLITRRDISLSAKGSRHRSDDA
jgi:hypothetical protein